MNLGKIYLAEQNENCNFAITFMKGMKIWGRFGSIGILIK